MVNPKKGGRLALTPKVSGIISIGEMELSIIWDLPLESIRTRCMILQHIDLPLEELFLRDDRILL